MASKPAEPVEVSMQRVVFTGGPGAGKTAVLRALHLRGYPVATDAARAVIQGRRGRGLQPRPSPREFAREILRLDIAQYRTRASAGIVFFERGVVDALGMLHEIGELPDTELHRSLRAYPYHREVFLFPAWEAIYANDEERDQTFGEAVLVCRRSSDWYRRCGYEVAVVPEATVAERCTFILRALGIAA